MLDEALAYPRRGEEVLLRHAIGGVFLLFSPLLLPMVLVYGYLVRVVRGVSADDPDPPAWDDWEGLFVDGLKFFVVTVAYGIPAMLLSGFVGMFAAGVAIGETLGLFGLTVAFGVVLVLFASLTALVGILTGYLLPAAVVRFVREDDLAAAFHLRTVAGNAFTRPYVVAWLQTVVVAFVFGIVGSILLVVFLAGLLVFFYLAVVGTYLLTRGYLAAADRSGAAPD